MKKVNMVFLDYSNAGKYRSLLQLYWEHFSSEFDHVTEHIQDLVHCFSSRFPPYTPH